MICGIIMISLPISIIGSNFTKQWERMSTTTGSLDHEEDNAYFRKATERFSDVKSVDDIISAIEVWV